MNKIKKVLAIILVLALMASFACIPVYADDSDVDLSRFTEGYGYLAFGDSITRGYGANHEKWETEGYKMDNTEDPECRNVTDSYPLLVANALGCYCPNNILDKTAEYWPIAQDAVDTAFLIDLLGIEDNFYDAEYLYGYGSVRRRYEADLYYFGDEDSMNTDGQTRYGKDGTAVSIKDLIAGSSLISIAIGMGDVLNRGRALGTDEFLEKGDMSDIAGLVQAVADCVDRMYEGYEYWKDNFDLILDYVKENKKDDAEVVIIGAINPIFNMTLIDDLSAPICSALSVLTDLMNKQYREWADEYGFIYVDIANVETGTTEDEMSFVSFLSSDTRTQGYLTHPTAEGYRQIARSIINALREKEAENKSSETDIRIDLGRIKNVTSVKVNGINVDDYDLDEDGVLTIHYCTKLATSVTVYGEVSEGKTAFTKYKLTYNDGYAAHRAYTTNDLIGVLKKILSNLNIINLIKKLF